MIAVTFALPAESSGLVARLRNREASDTGIVRGKIDRQNVAILHTGVGRKSCEAKIDNLLDATLPSILIAAGFAGAVRENLQVGELILAQNFSDAGLLVEAARILTDQHVKSAKLFTSPKIVDSIDERNQIARSSGADAVEMEAEFIARGCAARRIKMLSLRVVSDSPSNPFPAPPSVFFNIEKQRTETTALASYLLKHPLALSRFIAFARQVGKSREKLTNAIVDLVRGL